MKGRRNEGEDRRAQHRPAPSSHLVHRRSVYAGALKMRSTKKVVWGREDALREGSRALWGGREGDCGWEGRSGKAEREGGWEDGREGLV